MKVSTKGRYALRTMLDLAMHDRGALIPLKDISARQGITVKYLEQVMTLLSRAGYVRRCAEPAAATAYPGSFRIYGRRYFKSCRGKSCTGGLSGGFGEPVSKGFRMSDAGILGRFIGCGESICGQHNAGGFSPSGRGQS